MRLLLDTHTLIWAAEDSLRGKARQVIETGADAVFVSAATIWEIEIKRALGRLKVPEDVAGLVVEAGFEPLVISFEHARRAGQLPQLHGDPFDRMLIAQALTEGLTLATADADIRRYEIPVLVVTPV